MAHYRLSQLADEKIAAIYEYSVLHFGESQADEYFLGLHALFDVLAERSFLGRRSDELGEGLRRFVYKVHVIFYRPVSDGILVVDLFGVRQLRRAPFSGAAESGEAADISDTDE
jgi:toxin ParE1/3/4